jgi:hypothetical protein
MEVLADVNVPEEYVSALKGDGHEVAYSRKLPELGPEASDEHIVRYAETEGYALLSTDISDFSGRDADVPVLVAPQDMTGSEVRAAVARLEALPLDPSETDPIWLTAL